MPALTQAPGPTPPPPPRGLDALLPFLLTGVDFPWYYTLQAHYCPPPAVRYVTQTLAAVTTACFLLGLLTPRRSCGWPGINN